MNILLIGSGGREHALAWKLAQSPLLSRLFILPGNPGTAQHGQNLPGKTEDPAAVVEQARRYAIDLALIGPEAPLAAGLADALHEAGFLVFGPSAAAARIEASKAFSKAFMQRHAIPCAASQTFDRFDEAVHYLASQAQSSPQGVNALVLKASGLAAGKGVYLPETLDEAEKILHALLVEGSLGASGQQVVIEERLSGREVSLLAFTDGRDVLAMPPVQDHKRLLDDDCGPNTGGMGTFAPSPACPPGLVAQITRDVLFPTVNGLRTEGIPFTGVLYAGMMLTQDGPRVLEFNCRFGDPETQALMPLLQSDLVEIVLACAEGRLSQAAPHVRWSSGAAACVVVASSGYPEKPSTGDIIFGLEDDPPGRPCPYLIFHAGTASKEGKIVTAGGRVLGITAAGPDLEAAVSRAYSGVDRVYFKDMHYRRDIGVVFNKAATPSAYETAGVSITAGNEAVSLMRQAVRSTFTPQVLSDIGAFGGLFHAGPLKEMDDPVLAASTDGIGTKVDLAAGLGRFSDLGQDIVNHCINDILVQGARPLFFLDYIASDRLDPQRIAEMVAGMSAACREAGCALIGGETAEMPGVYAPDRIDVAGTIVGVVERSSILPRPDVKPGDVLLGLPSSGPHTNGYSLIRSIVAGLDLEVVDPELGISLGDALLAPHRSYLPWLAPVLFDSEAGTAPLQASPVKALAHLTGGAFYDNIPRILPDGCGARLEGHAWPVPPLFRLIQRLGGVDEREMYHVFNMGIGMVVVAAPEDLPQLRSAFPGQSWVIGEITQGEGVVIV